MGASEFFTYAKSRSCFALRAEGEKAAGSVYFVCLIIDEAPSKFRYEPSEDEGRLDMIVFSYLRSAGRNVAARPPFAGLQLLKIFLSCKCSVTE